MSDSDDTATVAIDPITFEVIRNSLIAASNEMALVVAKTAYSTPVNEGRDFAGTIYDRHGNLASQGEFDLPAFTGLTLLTVPEVIRTIGLENMQPGDVYMINDPYVASTHCNDVHLIKPVFRDGERIAFVASTCHWSDVGGVVAGSLNCRARSHFEEGVRIPAVAIYKAGVLNEDVLKVLLLNMRESWERRGDFNAQISALAAGEGRIQAIADRYGADVLMASMEEAQNHSERLIRAALRALPDGRYDSMDKVDRDLSTDEPKVIRLALTVDGDEAVFDLTGSDTAADCGINCTLPATTSAVFIALASILPPMPMNAGVMRAIDLKVTKGSLLWAQPPSAISGLAATSMECVISCVTQALSKAFPERGAGSPYSILNAVFAGFDDRAEFGSSFINYSWGFGGIGATKTHDGASCVGSPYTASTQNIPCELQERRYPVLYWRNMFLQDSGGPGRTRGGLGQDQLLSFPYATGTVSCIGNRERFGPPGVFGGHPGKLAHLILNRDSDQERMIGIFAVNEHAEKGDSMSFWSSGGGGYGDPLERDPAAVLEDVIDDYVSIEGAAEDFGVVVVPIDRRRLIYEIDLEATESLRASLRERTNEEVPA
ncbi:hydantoinase B/oxoprolinase family protein [Rhabdothermincola salaria]|uniref:hydantoinase B/oxoprolinase family protein n=1 Tax=Rhabdothermincola salaria TaxID=2903142 RepID=UPI001E3DEFE3|nr:hydantoinase B/oxoprolinase family protein [Rhabdothermincola salaria]